MAIYSRAVVRLLPQNSTQLKITPSEIILHTAVSSADSLYGWFASPGAKGAESHFYVREDGTVEQYMDTTVRADAQWAGNAHGVSIETWDNRAPATTPWNSAQLLALHDLLNWICDVHGIPRRICASPTDAGIGWHEQFVEWNQSHHSCPGSLREAQIPGLVAGLVPVPPQPKPPVPVPVQEESELIIVTCQEKSPGGIESGSFFYPPLARVDAASVKHALDDLKWDQVVVPGDTLDNLAGGKT